MTNKAESEALGAYWQEQIKNWETSGQTRTACCEQHALNYHRFGYWYQKFQQQAQESSTAERANFIPVSVQRQPGATGLSIPHCRRHPR